MAFQVDLLLHKVCCLVCILRYNIEQEQKLALETTVLVEQYTVRNYFIVL